MTLKTAEERRNMLSPALISEIGFFYIQARSLDPANRISFCRNLVSALRVAVRLTGEMELMPQINQAAQRCFTAQSDYSRGDWVMSNFSIDYVLDTFLAGLVHEGFGNLEEGSFSLPVSNAEVK